MNTHAQLLRDISEKIPTGVFASMELNLAEPANFQCVASQFGGEEHLTAHYPNLARILTLTRQTSKTPAESNTGFCNKAVVLDMGYDQASGTAYAMGTMTVTEPAERLYMTMDVYAEDALVAHNAVFLCACHAGEIETQSVPLPPLPDGKVYHAYLQATWQPKSANTLRSMIAKAESTSSSKNAIKDVTITHPRHIRSAASDAITVAYARSAPDRDYCYPETRDKTTGNEMVLLDMEGSANLADNYHVDSIVSAGAALSCVGFGDILYLGSLKFGKKGTPGVVVFPENDGSSIGWKFDQSWQNEIPDSVRYGNRSHDLEIGITFRCKEDKNLYTLLITSKGTELVLSQPHVQEISKVHLYWGCLAKGTQITMEDGSRCPIEEIKVNDRVLRPDGGSACVTKVITGTEENIYILQLENGMTVRASRNHPFGDGNGFIATIDLNSQSRLKTKDGLSPVLYCYPTDYHDTVYNLELDAGDSFLANGIVSGTNRIMGVLADQYNDSLLAVDGTPELLDECRRLTNDFEQGLL